MTDWLGDGLSIPLGRAHAFADAWPKTKVGNGGENGEGEWGSHKENLVTVPACIKFDTKKPIKDYIFFVNATELQCITN